MATENTETPTEPVEVTEPAEATEVVEADESAEATEPAEADESAEATEPAEADQSAEADEPAEADASAEVDASADDTESAEVNESAEATEPAVATESAEGEEEVAAEPDINEWSDDEQPPPGDTVDAVPEAPVVEEEEEKVEKRVDFIDTEAVAAEEDIPDFSKYRTNVTERLWRAKKADEEADGTSSPDIFKHEKEFQEFRKQMALLNRYVVDYENAMLAVAAKRNQVFQQYALLSKGTPLWDRIGEPLTDKQLLDVKDTGDLVTMEGVEERTHAIMKVADDIGAGSLMAHQQLAMMQDELNAIDFKKHTADHVEEWDEVVTSQVDLEVKQIRVISKRRDYYINKVDKLRGKVNRIERKGKGIAPKRLSDQLDRNEKKLAILDEQYQGKASGTSVLLYEATKRGWVDLYPVLKNVMKFEINRLGRESACYGSFHSTLSALKNDYREATQDTPDAPTIGSAL